MYVERHNSSFSYEGNGFNDSNPLGGTRASVKPWRICACVAHSLLCSGATLAQLHCHGPCLHAGLSRTTSAKMVEIKPQPSPDHLGVDSNPTDSSLSDLRIAAPLSTQREGGGRLLLSKEQ